MNTQPASFFFGDRLEKIRTEEAFVASIPDGIINRDQLFAVLVRELNFPSYFGRNWDALYDCLCDLSWIEPRLVIIDHIVIPELDHAALLAYLEVLRDCVQNWKPSEDHELLVIFPARARARICEIMSKGVVGS